MKKLTGFCDRYFVPDWREAKTWYSIWAFVVIGLSEALEGLWLWMPADLKAHIPVEWMPRVVTIIAVVGLIGRLIKQREKDV